MDRWFLDRLIELGQLIAGHEERLKSLEHTRENAQAVEQNRADRQPAWAGVIVNIISVLVALAALALAIHTSTTANAGTQALPVYHSSHGKTGG